MTSSPSGVGQAASLESKEFFQRKRRGDSGRNHFPKPAGESTVRSQRARGARRIDRDARRHHYARTGTCLRQPRASCPATTGPSSPAETAGGRRALDALLLPPQLPDALDQDVGTEPKAPSTVPTAPAAGGLVCLLDRRADRRRALIVACDGGATARVDPVGPAPATARASSAAASAAAV